MRNSQLQAQVSCGTEVKSVSDRLTHRAKSEVKFRGRLIEKIL